ncbi:MAG: hypothetical protein K2I79_01690 [Clostridia bacterium]|nr:hypothetical protein [Clostridia bacterium]
MDLNKLLEYQEADKQVFKFENELRGSEEAKKLQAYREYFKKSQDALIRINAVADGHNAKIDKYSERYDALMSELKELEETIESVDSLKEIEFYIRSIGELSDSLESLAKDIASAVKDMKSVSSQADSEVANINKSHKGIQLMNEKYAEVKKKVQQNAAPYISKLKSLEKDIDPNIMEHYKRVRGNKKMPVLVEFNSANSACGGCGMDLSENEKGKLSSCGICECPHCGRIVYQAE